MKEQTKNISENSFIEEIEKYINGENLVDCYNYLIGLYNETERWAIDLSVDNNIIISRNFIKINKINNETFYEVFISSYFHYLFLYNNFVNHNNIKDNDSFFSTVERLYLKLNNFSINEKIDNIYLNSLKECVTNYKLELFIEKINEKIKLNNIDEAFKILFEIRYNLTIENRNHLSISQILLEIRNKCFTEINLNFKNKDFKKTLNSLILFNKILNEIDSRIKNDYYNNFIFKNKLFLNNTKVSIYSYCLMKIHDENFFINPNNIIYQKMLLTLNSCFSKKINNVELSENEKKIFLFCCNMFVETDKNDDLNSIIHKMINNVDFYYEDFQYLEHNDNDLNFYVALEHYIYKSYMLTESKINIENFFKLLLNTIETYYMKEQYQKTLHLFENYFFDLKNFKYIIERFDKYFISILRLNDKGVDLSVNSSIFKFYYNFAEIEKLPNIDVSNKFLIYSSTSFFNFGKYMTKKVIDVCEVDKEYILWCIINLNHFILDEKEFFIHDFKNCKLFLKAIEYNLIKYKVLDLYTVNKIDEDEDENGNQNYSENYTIEDSYYDGGGGDEWSDPSEFW